MTTKSKKTGKKRKKTESGGKSCEASKPNQQTVVHSLMSHMGKKARPAAAGSAAGAARSSVAKAMALNPVLSSLFSNERKQTSEKVRRDDLFTRNC